MRVIIFAGHHKVGSTSLQDFLSRNAVALARAGILYPSVDFEGMSLMLAQALGREVPDSGLPINAREPHNALAFRMLAEHQSGRVPPYHVGLPSKQQMVRAIRKQVRFVQPDVVILAAEVFANFAPAGNDLIAQLADLFPGGEITVLATLRRIDEYLASWHGQRLKFGHDVKALSDGGLQAYYTNIHFNYRKMLEGWFETLPQARFILRNYADVRAAGGSVVDFFARAGIALPDGLVPEQKTNESLHRGIYEISRRGNQGLPPALAQYLRQALRIMTPDLGLPASGEIELFGAENRHEMAERFAPIDAWLGERSGRTGFFPDLDAVATPLPVPEAEAYARALAEARRRDSEIEEPDVRAFLKQLAAEPVH